MGAGESYPDIMTHRLAGELALGDAVAAARGFGEARALADRDTARLCIVVEELVANLYDHGGLEDGDEVELSLASEPGAIRIVIGDAAVPFDPRSARPVSTIPQRGGGAGLDVVRAWAEIVDYRTTDQGNRLVLLLPLSRER